ncbi:class I SAM-dependent methyltransferase [Streptomyces sp. NPDC020917]|uniref:class I SAM-dependent methyltransferase n=1 Tax=Streptomyces sp. NPDC020917 TaxID=3365102 RepID=UPI0037AA9944
MPTSSSTGADASTGADLWHHYGRARAARDRAIPGGFHWDWAQDGGPGAEILGDLTGRVVADLGAGSARHAAHLATRHQPARVDAVDNSPAQQAFATALYGHLAPTLRIVPRSAVDHLRASPHAYDVLYAVFGAPCFTDPRQLLPAAAAALRPGGRLVFSTLAHYAGGRPAEADAVHADIPAATPDGRGTTMPRWVLQGHVWQRLLEQSGFTGTTVGVLPAAGGPRGADALLVGCTRAA